MVEGWPLDYHQSRLRSAMGHNAVGDSPPVTFPAPTRPAGAG